jgi:hypothetical protein
VDTFWCKAWKTESCWIWKGSLAFNGHHHQGLFKFRRKMQKATRVAFYLARGFWPKMALHTCDNPLCVNPSHLYDGDHSRNMKDRAERGRTFNKWSWIAERARDLRAYGCTQMQIAEWFGCPRTVVRYHLRAAA